MTKQDKVEIEYNIFMDSLQEITIDDISGWKDDALDKDLLKTFKLEDGPSYSYLSNEQDKIKKKKKPKSNMGVGFDLMNASSTFLNADCNKPETPKASYRMDASTSSSLPIDEHTGKSYALDKFEVSIQSALNSTKKVVFEESLAPIKVLDSISSDSNAQRSRLATSSEFDYNTSHSYNPLPMSEEEDETDLDVKKLLEAAAAVYREQSTPHHSLKNNSLQLRSWSATSIKSSTSIEQMRSRLQSAYSKTPNSNGKADNIAILGLRYRADRSQSASSSLQLDYKQEIQLKHTPTREKPHLLQKRPLTGRVLFSHTSASPTSLPTIHTNASKNAISLNPTIKGFQFPSTGESKMRKKSLETFEIPKWYIDSSQNPSNHVNRFMELMGNKYRSPRKLSSKGFQALHMEPMPPESNGFVIKRFERTQQHHPVDVESHSQEKQFTMRNFRLQVLSNRSQK